MNEEEKKKLAERVKEILKSHDIEMTVQGCGCCDSPEVSFKYKGEVIVSNAEHFNIV